MRPKPKMDGSSLEAKLPLTPRKYKNPEKFKFEPPPEAPVFLPTLEEFENPLKYINKIRPIGQKTGICKIIPPAGWKVPFVLDMNELKFTPRIQRINELEARTRIKLNFIDQLTKFFALKGKTFQIPILEKRTLDLYTLHKLVKDYGGAENVTKSKKWSEISLKMNLTNCKTPLLLRAHYDHLILPFISSRHEAERKQGEMGENDGKTETGEVIPSLRELKSLTFLGPGPKMAVCDLAFSKSVKTRTRGKKILYEFDPLAKYMCKSCSYGEIEEESLVTCISCDDRYHSLCLIPPLTEANTAGWRCPKCVATEACKSLEEFGFAQAEKEYTLTEFKDMADKFKCNYFKTNNPKEVSTGKVEGEFWKVVSSIEESVTVEYGADLHVIDHGSGFPLKDKPTGVKIDPELFNKYAESAWNLNNLPVLKASVLRHISADISGMKIPWMYAGMCFATFCWHNEDHWSYSINYLHLGEPKTWYGVPGSSAEDFEKAMKQEAPELFDSQPDILHQLVTIMNPNDIMKTGVPIYRTDQKEGEFVITFPRAYHAGFNQGFNFAEACNFAPFDWLHIGRECISHYSSLKRYCVFSHDELICKMAEIYDELDKKILIATYKDMKTMITAEQNKRRSLLLLGIKTASRVKFDEVPDDERQCFVCKTTCFLSAVVCKCNPSRLVCLDHHEQLCICPPSNYRLKYHYKIDELVAVLYVMRNKVEHFDKWFVGINKPVSDLNRKIYFKIFTELLSDTKGKNFTKDELLLTLEGQVKNCLKLSSIAKSFLKGIDEGNVKKPDQRNSVDDLIDFSKQLKSIPCSLVEDSSITKMLESALKLQKIAKKLINSRVPNKNRIEHTISLMKNMNLEFKEEAQLQLKLLECEWLQKCSEVLSKTHFSEDVQTLIELGDKLPNSRSVMKQRNELHTMLFVVESWTDKIKSIYLLPYMTLDKIKALHEESLTISCINVEERDKLTKLVKDASEINKTINDLLSGKAVLYFDDILEVISQARSTPVAFESLDKIVEQVQVTTQWFGTARKTFIRPTSTLDNLMRIFWPRRFLPRTISQSNEDIFCNDEYILQHNDKNFSQADYKKAYREQLRSLLVLRLKNTELNKLNERNCPCGKPLQGRTAECDLCLTVYHPACICVNMVDVSAAPRTYMYFHKVICNQCVKGKLPPWEKVIQLFRESKSLMLKIPECFAFEWHVNEIISWQARARKQLITKDLLNTLNLINENSLLINKVQSLPLATGYEFNLMDEEAFATMSFIIEKVSNLRSVKLNPNTVTELRILMYEGDLLEVSALEKNNIWVLLQASKLSNFFGPEVIAAPDIPESVPEVFQTIKTIKVVKKPIQKIKTNLKRVIRKPNKDCPLPKMARQNKSLPILSSIVNDPKSPGSSSIYSEHEEECAAEECLKPIEDNLHWIQCDGKCSQWFHMKCVSLDKEEVGADFEFMCLNCETESSRSLAEEEVPMSTIDCSTLTLFADPLITPKTGRATL